MFITSENVNIPVLPLLGFYINLLSLIIKIVFYFFKYISVEILFHLLTILEMNGTKETEEQAEKDAEMSDAMQEDEGMRQGVCEEAQQSETPEKMPPPVDQLRTPKLSDFGLSALQFQRVLGEAEQPLIAAPVPAVALSPPPFVMNMHPPQPKTPKCSLRMEEDAPTPRLEDFGISEYTMCWNNDFTMDLFNKKPPKSCRYTISGCECKITSMFVF